MYHSSKRFTYRNTPGLLFHVVIAPGVCHTGEQTGVNVGDKICVYTRCGIGVYVGCEICVHTGCTPLTTPAIMRRVGYTPASFNHLNIYTH